MYETVLYEKDDGVANIALNRPERLNAFDTTMHDELYRALGDAAQDEEIRSIVVRGEGRGFLRRRRPGAGRQRSGGRSRPGRIPAHHIQPARDADGWDREAHSRRPARACLRRGVGLALACDLRVAAQSAKFSVAFIKIGLMPDAGVTFLLPASSASAELWR